MRSLRKGGTIAVGKIGFSNLPSLVYGIVRSSTPGDNNSTGRLHTLLDARTARKGSRSQFISSLLSPEVRPWPRPKSRERVDSDRNRSEAQYVPPHSQR